MSSTNISFGLIVALLAIPFLYKIRKPKTRVAQNGSQRMCPACGLITSRLKAFCSECGQPLTVVSVTETIEK
jgi:predicted amidophosphoribosyltransferase